MPRRKRDEAVAERANQILDEQAERRRQSAQRGAQTRRERRAQQAQDQPQPERPTRANVARNARERVHADLVTVAFRGPLAGKFREMAERYQMALATLLKDAMLSYESNVTAGYQPGASLAEWKAQQPPKAPQVAEV